MFKDGLQTAAGGEVDRVLTDPHDIAQNTKKQDTDSHFGHSNRLISGKFGFANVIIGGNGKP
jgi:hypothetical protein